MTRISARRLEQLEAAACALWLYDLMSRRAATDGVDRRALAQAIEGTLRDWPIFSLNRKLGAAHPLVRDLERRRLERDAAAHGISVEELIALEREVAEDRKAKCAERRRQKRS
jgi:hypothetical protein